MNKMKKQIVIGPRVVIPSMWNIFMIRKRMPLSDDVFLEEGRRYIQAGERGKTACSEYMAVVRQDINHYSNITKRNRRKREYLIVAEKSGRGWLIYGKKDANARSKKKAREALIRRWRKDR